MPEPRRPSRPASQLPIASSTWFGYVATTHDALLLLEAAKRGLIPRITRRLDEDERRRLVASGHIFIFDEREADIRRWTDGLVWSPSRILQNFLVYRQIERRNPRPTAPARPSLDSALSLALSPASHPRDAPWSASGSPAPPPSWRRARALPASKAALPAGGDHPPPSLETDHRLRTGSLDSALDMSPPPASPRAPKRKGEYSRALSHVTSHSPFVRHGLCKKTISVECNGSQTHLIAYYSLEDVRDGRLRPPSTFPELASLRISREFLQAAMGFRSPPNTRVEADGSITYLSESFVGDIPASFLPDEYRSNPASARPAGPGPGPGSPGGAPASVSLGAVLGSTPPAVVSPSGDVPAFASTLSPRSDPAAAPHANAMGFGLPSPTTPHPHNMSMLPSGVPIMVSQVSAPPRAHVGDVRYIPQDDYAGVHYYSSPPSSGTTPAAASTPGSGSGPFFPSPLGMYPAPYDPQQAYLSAPPTAPPSSPKGTESKRLRMLPGMSKEQAHAHVAVRPLAPVPAPSPYPLLDVVPGAPMWPAEGAMLPALEGNTQPFASPMHRSPSAPGGPS